MFVYVMHVIREIYVIDFDIKVDFHTRSGCREKGYFLVSCPEWLYFDGDDKQPGLRSATLMEMINNQA